MKNPTNYRNTALSLTLGLFTFHLYMVGHLIVERQMVRGLASESTECAPFQSVEALEASDAHCRFSYVLNEDSGEYAVNIIYGDNTTSINVSLEQLGLEEGATESEIRTAIISGVRVVPGEGFRISYGGEGAVDPAPVAADPVPAASGAIDPEDEDDEAGTVAEVVAEPDMGPEPEETEEVEVNAASLVLERIEELRNQVEEVSSCMSDAESSRAERLLTNAERYSENRISTDLENAEDRLNDLEELLADVSDEECEEEEEAVASGNPSEQWRMYTTEMLPRVREALATTGSIDGVEGLEELARSNPMIDNALGIEVRAYTISAGIHQNTALILQARNTPGADPAQIEALEAQNQELLNQLASLSDPSVSGELSPVARNAVSHWSNFHGTQQEAAIALAGPAQQILEDGTAVDPSFGTDVNPNPSVAGASDLNALDNFLRQVRQTYESTRIALNSNRNRVGENARAGVRQAAPQEGTRVLDIGGSNVRSIQSL